MPSKESTDVTVQFQLPKVGDIGMLKGHKELEDLRDWYGWALKVGKREYFYCFGGYVARNSEGIGDKYLSWIFKPRWALVLADPSKETYKRELLWDVVDLKFHRSQMSASGRIWKKFSTHQKRVLNEVGST